ncbi:MAG: response regulator [Candidatus Omnitrophica bacterium]|nr:response regulator [Candidatus Omnitrophota bacterium]
MPYTVLLVDDDREFREEFAESLSEYHVIEAQDGPEALRILEKPNAVDAVILDVMMPGSSGIDVLRQIKRRNPNLGIIILTGYSSKDVAIEALKGRADDYLEKPLDVDTARRVIEDLLTRRRPAGPAGRRPLEGKIAQVKEFVARNCLKKVGLADVARAVYLSPKYLSRIFEEQTGERFTHYRLKLKIAKAKQMLKTGSHNVDQIADALGYKNAESFIRQFKKYTGQTPTEFRRNSGVRRTRR